MRGFLGAGPPLLTAGVDWRDEALAPSPSAALRFAAFFLGASVSTPNSFSMRVTSVLHRRLISVGVRDLKNQLQSSAEESQGQQRGQEGTTMNAIVDQTHSNSHRGEALMSALILSGVSSLPTPYFANSQSR